MQNVNRSNLLPKLALIIGLLSVPISALPQAPAGDQVVALVDKRTITAHDLDFWAFAYRLQRADAEGTSPAELRQRVLHEAVDDMLLSGWAELQLNAVPDAAVDARLRAAWDRYERLAGGAERLDDLLADAKLDREAFRLWVRERGKASFLTREALSLYANLGGDTQADAELRDAQRIRLAHILVVSAGDSENALGLALERALRIRRDLEAGIPFASAAELYSDDETSKNESGELGWFTPEELAPELWKAAVEAPRGKASAPVKTAAGYHLLLVMDFETESQKRFLENLRTEERRRLRMLREESEIRLANGFTLREVPKDEGEPEEPSFWNRLESGMPPPSE